MSSRRRSRIPRSLLRQTVRFTCAPGRAARTGTGALLFLLSGFLFGQGILAPTLPNAWLATTENPALYGRTDGQFSLGLGGLHEQLYLGGLAYNDLILRENGRNVLDLNHLIDRVGPNNLLENNLALETLSAGWRTGKWGFGISHRIRSDTQFEFPRTLARIIGQGNARYIGETVEIAPAGFTSNYHELALGLSYAVNENVTLGARMKAFSGIDDVRIEPGGSLRLSTDDQNFALLLEQDLTINSAGPLEYGGLDDLTLNYSLASLTLDEFFGGNRGYAVDLGVYFDYEKLRVQAAVSDLGATLRWRDDVTNLSLSGPSDFSGLDVLARLFEEDFSFEASLDSLERAFEPTATQESYTTRPGAAFLAAGELDVTDRLMALAVVRYGEQPLKNTFSAALGARYAVLEELHVALHYNVRGNDGLNLGAQVYGRLGPVRLLLGTDDLTALVRPREAGELGLRAGLALSFGQGINTASASPDS